MASPFWTLWDLEKSCVPPSVQTVTTETHLKKRPWSPTYRDLRPLDLPRPFSPTMDEVETIWTASLRGRYGSTLRDDPSL